MSFTLDSVLRFPSKVRRCFSSRPESYDAFLDIVKKYSSSEIDIQELVRKLSELMKGHPSIIKEFNELLPDGITLKSFTEIFCADEISAFQKKTEACENTDNDADILFKCEAAAEEICADGQSDLTASNSFNCVSCVMEEEDNCSDIDKTKEQSQSLAEVSKYGTFKELAFFDKVRRLMGNDETYLNFMRCITLYTKDIVTGSELIEILQPFTLKDPELSSELRRMIGCSSSQPEPCTSIKAVKRKSSETSLEIDYASCKKHGISYRALPTSYPQPFCTGRSLVGNEVCNEVLNDTWVSFPLWSEDSTFGNSKISQYEEFLYRCEDERFELDVVIDSMASTVQLLEEASVKLSRLNTEEAKAYQLDVCLGGSSEVHPRKSIERIYGDKVGDVMESLIHRPYVAVPIVLRRLKSRIEEFREARKNYIKVWKDECEKNYGKWLQSQATTFRQLDARQMRTKTLINEAEVTSEETFGDRFCCRNRHQEFVFTRKSDLLDATNLIIHYLNYLPTVQTDDSFRISQMLHDTLPQLISMPGVRPSNSSNSSSSNSSHDIESEEQYAVMFTNSGWYVFLRHFHMFCKRLEEIRLQCERLQRDELQVELVLRNGVKTNSYYEFIYNVMRLMIEGAIDVFAYETDMQKVLGANAYVTFSVEKILHNIVKQLQSLVTDELNKKLMEIFNEERARGAAGGNVSTAYKHQLLEYAYLRRVIPLISDEYCFKIVFFKYKRRVTMELIDTEADSAADDQMSVQLRTVNYVDCFLDANDKASDYVVDIRTVLLLRNLRKQSKQKSFADSERKLRHVDKTRCLIGSSTLKVTFANGSWSFMYRDKSFTLARKMCRLQAEIKKQKFYDWWSNWRVRHVTAEQERRARDWLTRSTHNTRTAKSQRLRERQTANVAD